MEVTSLNVFLKFTSRCHASLLSHYKLKVVSQRALISNSELTLEWSSPSTSSEAGGSGKGVGGRGLPTHLDIVRKAGVPKIKLERKI